MELKALLNQIFSVSEYCETHLIVRILGIKIKLKKYEYLKKQKNTPYEQYKRNKVDITTIPPAQGQIRDIQLANLVLLKELDYVCRQNNLKYWLDFGTLLGAIRHKGFIPWDDDIDVSMMREDYEIIINAFQISSGNSDIYAEQTYLGRAQTIIKVKHKKCPHLFVDIFPLDYSNSVKDRSQRLLETKKLKEIRKKLNKDKNIDNSEKVLNKTKELYLKLFGNVYIEKSDVQFGLDCFFVEPLLIYSNETIFPLKEIQFENFNAMCMNKPEEYLSDIYGDYMSYPKKFGMGHSMYMKLSDEEYKEMKKLCPTKNPL